MKDTSSSIAVPFMHGNVMFDELKSSKTSSSASGNENYGRRSPKFQCTARKYFVGLDITDRKSENKNDLVSDSKSRHRGVDDFVKKKKDLGGLNEEKVMVQSDIGVVNNEFNVNLSLWGSKSICGMRKEMEDTTVAFTNFLKIPMQMFMDSKDLNDINRNLPEISANFFGVYDGHGGSEVANYCHDRIHLAFAEELETAKGNSYNWREQWEKTFLGCFSKVDAEVAGIHSGQPIAPDAVGSTAVVAVVCPKLIIVANCGDSRAVLYREKVAVPLSEDHKPNRKDEQERIEAAGGKVINWDGFRVSSVLALSRSIGDRYLDPYVISDPEVSFFPRSKEDECLILASDGLWDVVKNDKACEIARKRILLWHKRNGNTVYKRGEGVDPAAQDAADYLSKLALHKGSKDNISVIVVDLKAQRKFKKRPSVEHI